LELSPDKVLHFLATLLVVAVVGSLVLGYRDRARVDLSDQLAAVLAVFAGLLVAMFVELLEFLSDWLLGTLLQPSNTETMTDLLASDLGAVVGALLATTVYCRWLNARQRQRLGERAVWLTDGPSRMLHEHGFAITLAVSVVIGVAVGALWFTGRPVPGFPIV
jgi:NAD/NADP transhydrogenase beta subunit